MKINFTFFALFCLTMAVAQPQIDSWIMNAGQYASYWQNTNGNPNNPSFVFYTSTTLADVTKVCYNETSVWVKSEGMTTDMGQFLNPGAPTAQNYTYIFPRTPTVPTSKTISPKLGSIGLLVNGVPIYGLSNAHYYNGTNNNGMGQGTWNVEVYKSEGFVLDATLGAHPQQQGAYHSHAKPYRLYQESGDAIHSPIVGYAFDGYPVYGPYGYTNANDATSAITRMRTGYALRNITTRTTLPYNVALTSANYGPAVNSTYPIGTYIEDYEWLESNGGTLDKYNGRFCVTPEYPEGTYAYFVTLDAAGTPQFPYYVGVEYYGAPQTADLGPNPTVTVPSTATCMEPLEINEVLPNKKMSAYPNPSNGNFTLSLPDLSGESLIEIFTVDGKKVFTATTTTIDTPVSLSETGNTVLMVKVTNNGNQYVTKMMMQ
ncbi:YHYH protein [Flavobacterium sp. DGU11]|uniref:YHYH protein n=1 Tax=Flavobacterium arundinis TaxID=3139143 RepID=A0ABU9HX83_9FLAO